MTSPPRLIFMAQPPAEVRQALHDILLAQGLAQQLGNKMFAPENWHQSLSLRFDDDPAMRARLLRAGGRLVGECCTVLISQVSSSGWAARPPLHWAFRMRGRLGGLFALQRAVRQALQTEHLHDDGRHSGHITVSYNAPAPLAPVPVGPVRWTLSEVLLVCGAGQPYRYEVLGRWPLRAPPVQAEQLTLPW